MERIDKIVDKIENLMERIDKITENSSKTIVDKIENPMERIDKIENLMERFEKNLKITENSSKIVDTIDKIKDNNITENSSKIVDTIDKIKDNNIKDKYYNFNKFIIFIPYCSVYKSFIEECLESVFNQDYTNYEIIIVNDGGDLFDLNNYLENDKITTLNFENNNGPSFSKWKFVEYIQTNLNDYNKNDICILLDGDDYLLDNALNIINDTYINNKCWCTFGDSSGKFIDKNREIYKKTADYSKIRNSNWFASHPRTMKLFLLMELKIIDFQFNREWLQKCSDRIMIYKIFEQCGHHKISYINSIIYNYREHDRNSYKTFRGDKKAILNYCNNSPKCKVSVEDIHIIMCCWKRYQNLNQQFEMLNNQTVSNRIHLHLINNNFDKKEEIEKIVEKCKNKYKNIKLILSHYKNEFFGFQRFIYIRDYLIKKFNIDYVIIIDDDQLYDNKWVENMWNLRKPKLYTSWYCKKWNGKYDYWNDTMINHDECIQNMKKDIEYTDYNGTGGSLIDVSIFYNNSPLWNKPDDLPEGVSIYNIEDLYLSFVSKYELGYSLKRSFLPERRTLNNFNQSNQVSLWHGLLEKKRSLLLYLVNKYIK